MTTWPFEDILVVALAFIVTPQNLTSKNIYLTGLIGKACRHRAVMWAWVMLQRPKDSSARSLGSLGRNDKKETASLRMTEKGNAARTHGRRDACPTKDRAPLREFVVRTGRLDLPHKGQGIRERIVVRAGRSHHKGSGPGKGPQSRYRCELELDGNCVRDALHVIAR